LVERLNRNAKSYFDTPLKNVADKLTFDSAEYSTLENSVVSKLTSQTQADIDAFA